MSTWIIAWTAGELACWVTEEGILYQEDNFLSVSTLCGNAMVFAPKYRRKVFYGEKRAEVGAILRHLVKYIFADTTLQLHKPYVQKILCDAICESYNSFSPWNSVQLPSIFGSASGALGVPRLIGATGAEKVQHY